MALFLIFRVGQHRICASDMILCKEIPPLRIPYMVCSEYELCKILANPTNLPMRTLVLSLISFARSLFVCTLNCNLLLNAAFVWRGSSAAGCFQRSHFCSGG